MSTIYFSNDDTFLLALSGQVPLVHEPEDTRSRAAIAAALAKDYSKLEDCDITLILNAHCDSVRSKVFENLRSDQAPASNDIENIPPGMCLRFSETQHIIISRLIGACRSLCWSHR